MIVALRRALALAGAAIVLLAAPAAAGAAIGGPYQIVDPGGGVLDVSPVTPGGTLVVQTQRVGTDVVFSPAAEAPLPASCLPGAGVTTCTAASLASGLSFTGGVVEVGVHDVDTSLLTFRGGVGNDSLVVDGAGTIATVSLDPRGGDDAMTLDGAITTIDLVAPDPGNDRYDIRTTTLAPATLSLGDGNDVVSNRSASLTVRGGAGDDTLSGAGPLQGDGGDDLLEPTVTGQPADGGAGTDRLAFDLIDTPLEIAKAGTNVAVGGVTKTGIELLEGGRGNDTISGDGGPDVISGGDGNDTIAGGGGGDTLDGGPGVNTVSYATATGPVSVDLAAGTANAGVEDQLTAFRGVVTGSGSDTVFGTPGDEFFDLGAGNDTLNAGAGNDTISGGPGDDLLRGGHGTDAIDGGTGRDTATYDERTASEPVSVTLLTPGDEGAGGENDTLTGIEDVVGGASSDVLVGDNGPNVLIGGGGLNTLVGNGGDDVLVGGDFRDVLSGGPGFDQLLGGGDDDSLDAFDGGADVVDCGPSADDDAQVDAFDMVVGCEFARRGDVPVPVDADGDGSVAGFDCNDANPAIGLAAVEIAGDGVDQNCDGFDEPLPLVAMSLRLSFSRPSSRGTRITRLTVSQLAPSTTVVVTCRTPKARRIKARKGRKARTIAVPRSRRCPFTRRTLRSTSGRTTVSFTKLIRRRQLAVGTRVELRVTAPGTIGRVRRVTVRRSADLRLADRCVLPGSSVAKTCPADVL